MLLTDIQLLPFLNHSAKNVQTRTELSLLKLCRVQPFLNHDAKVRQFSDTTKFHPAELC